MTLFTRPSVIDTTERYKMMAIGFACLFFINWMSSDIDDFKTKLIVSIISISIVLGGMYYYSWKDKIFIKKLNKIMLITVAFYLIMAILPLLIYNDL